jgi:hypothetical protein
MTLKGAPNIQTACLTRLKICAKVALVRAPSSTRAAAAGGAVVVALILVGVSAIDAAGRSQASRRSADCGQRVTVVGVRGSGDAQSGDVATDKYGDQVHGMGKPGAALAVELANKLSRGAVTFDPVVYPAVGLLGNWRKIINTVGAGAKIGFLGSYNGSVNDGKAALRQVISSEARVCPKVKLVLAGYSQGAQVVADVYQRDLSPSQRSRIAGVVVFGDPYFNPADTKPDVGSYDPTRYGGLGKRGLYPSSSTPIFSICHLYDPICQGPGRDDFSQHTNYQNDPWIKIAAAKIAAELSERSVQLSVKHCQMRLTVGGERPTRTTTPVSVSDGSKQPGAYGGDGLVVIGPAGWSCAGSVSGDGSTSLAVWPSGETPAHFGTSTDPFPRPQAVTATLIPACVGCRSDMICPFLPADANALHSLGPCTTTVPKGEVVHHPKPHVAVFQIPAHLTGTSSYSGGSFAVIGTVVNVPDSAGRQGYSAEETCAVAAADARACTVASDNFITLLSTP